MATELEICNSTLIKCGAEKIVAVTDQNKRAIAVHTQYPLIRDKLLYDHPWKFAMARVALTEDATPPVFGFATRYALPADCVRPLELDDECIEYAVEGGYILTDTTGGINLKYIKKVTDPTLFDPMFCEALATLLAADIAYQIVQSAALKKEINDMAEAMIARLRSYHSQQGTPRKYKIDTFRNARR